MEIPFAAQAKSKRGKNLIDFFVVSRGNVSGVVVAILIL